MAPQLATESVKMFSEMEAKPTVEAAKKLAEMVREVDGAALAEAGLFQAIETASQGGKKAEAKREAACLAFGALSGDLKNHLEAYVIKLFPVIFQLVGDKAKNVAKVAHDAAMQFVGRAASNPAVANSTMAEMMHCLDSTKFQVKVAGLEAIGRFAKECPGAVSVSMPELVPAVCDLLHDTKVQVTDEAEQTLRAITDVVKNKDVEELIPHIMKALMEPDNVPDCIFQLSCTKFVATVERPELALITPLLVRGFREAEKKIVRQSAKITDNLSKLVEVPTEAEPLLPKLTPALELAASHVSDPECRDVCGKVTAQLGKLKAHIDALKSQSMDSKKFLAILEKDKRVHCTDPVTLSYAADLCASNFFMKVMDPKEWARNLGPVCKTQKDAADIGEMLFKQCENAMRGTVIEDEEDAAELCNCRFTLAYGTKTLLKNTQLRLLKGMKYGLLGGNDSGKTSLLKAIAKDQVEGFPPSTEVRTVFVEADILGELSHLTCIEYIFEDPRIKAANLGREAVCAALEKVGFAGSGEQGGKAARIMDPVSSLSGGWRMKLALARAMLQKADILLMDDPTNHLDVKNVAWVEDYIRNLNDVTAIIVSQNAHLLETCCTRIIHIDNLRLHNFKGSIKAFVEEYPEAKSYFELKSSKGLSFRFPDPGFLEGVSSRGKVLIKMDKVTFTYPGNPRPTVVDLTVRVSMGSRVACLGPNGAGKSTMIKLLTGELNPDCGTTWKNANAKVAYVAQHAFHHIEKHLKMTPTEYILWRYEYGTDKEALEKVTMILTEEEEKKLLEVRTWEYVDDEGLKRQKQVIQKLTGIRKNQKRSGYMYEVRFATKGTGDGPTAYINEDKLDEGGWGKHVKQAAEKILAEEGRFKRPLTQANVEKLLTDVGMEREHATHTQMSQLSGGQKVKVVLGAAMWDQPHIVILDEPTNYLDRESLAALACAIEAFKGGVVIITHNDQFSKHLCPETWLVEKGDDGIGRLDCRGDADWMEAVMKEKTESQAMDEMVDALGNVTKVKTKKRTLTRKEKKQRELAKKKAEELGEHWSSSEEE